MEFGVLRGRSLRQIAAKFPDRTVYGFDTFEGLIEDWGEIARKGDMSVDGKLPVDMPGNVSYVIGLIGDTLPTFLSKHPEPISFIHIDTDTYLPAKAVMDSIDGRLSVGTVILFDEYRGYPGYEEHEYKAFTDFCAAHPELIFEEMNLDDPGVWSVSRSLAAYSMSDMIKSCFTRPKDIAVALWNRITKKHGDRVQAAFRVVSITQ